jgi:hypothetical protein
MKNPVGDVVVPDQRKHLRLVDISRIGMGVQNPVCVDRVGKTVSFFSHGVRL